MVGIFFFTQGLVQKSATHDPAFHLYQLALVAAGAPSLGSPILHLAVLAGITLALTGLAVRRLARVG